MKSIGMSTHIYHLNRKNELQIRSVNICRERKSLKGHFGAFFNICFSLFVKWYEELHNGEAGLLLDGIKDKMGVYCFTFIWGPKTYIKQ